jgi:hypothetical protein
MLPEIRTMHINGREEVMLNASATIELIRTAGTPIANRILRSYHAAEADIAASQPWLSEERIRSDALLRALADNAVSVEVQPD